MASIHRTTLTPSKLELLTTWLPTQPWYRGRDTPSPAKAGGFRLDDPAGEVGIELMIVTDGADAYLVPMTYRSAPGEGTLIDTMQHGVLGVDVVRRLDAVVEPDLPGTVSAPWRGPDGEQTRGVVLRHRTT